MRYRRRPLSIRDTRGTSGASGGFHSELQTVIPITADAARIQSGGSRTTGSLQVRLCLAHGPHFLVRAYHFLPSLASPISPLPRGSTSLQRVSTAGRARAWIQDTECESTAAQLSVHENTYQSLPTSVGLGAEPAGELEKHYTRGLWLASAQPDSSNQYAQRGILALSV
ncbi:LAQU0S05e04236g1_1 [Lachancea quebecensis]|uniref:LAQU0S05e04236g1_1 n=1 Tax=Lachancea quebecensis TaxID=1654605 RepID=A0A0P1KQN0_9SACH|nr:LAQU0S05e04236g1_1 [Lachancea quebecensis]